jgi:ferrous iron transport protein B
MPRFSPPCPAGDSHGGRRRRRFRRGFRHGGPNGRRLTIALAGNANVGKSVIFNQLTGSRQITGNWPGKTVERAEGWLHFDGRDVTIVDLPGIYSLSTYSTEELVTRDYIAWEKPDVVVNVVGAPVLERNLFFTLQLLEMDVPLVVCLNQMDIAEDQGIAIDIPALEGRLGCPVVATIAAAGMGMRELIATAVECAEHPAPRRPPPFAGHLETAVEELRKTIETERPGLAYAPRWTAIKLLERDPSITELVGAASESAVRSAAALSRSLEERRQQPAYVAIASERYALAETIARSVESRRAVSLSLADRLDRLATHRVFGYGVSLGVIGLLLAWTFTVGTLLSNWLTQAFAFFQPVDPKVGGTLIGILGNGLFGGFVAGVTLVVPYVLPFYAMLAVMEDSGILTRVAFMLDSAMHRMGLHGKAIIPIILGYGCNVPAICATRIMTTRRERLLSSLAITFAPCAARTIIIMGLVAAFAGFGWALLLYAIDILLLAVVVKIASKAVPGELTGLIMEMHSFKMPSLSVVGRQIWARTRSLVTMVFPVYMAGTAAVQVAYGLGWLGPVNRALSFLTVGWLGLPAAAGVLLIFGAVRKELILLMAAALFGSNVGASLAPVQLIVLALVGTVYPCLATVGALAREFGWKATWGIIGVNTGIALFVGGLAARLLPLIFR